MEYSGQFNRPIGVIQERFPALILGTAQAQRDGGISFWSKWRANKLHSRLNGSSTAFARVAFHAGAHQIFPRILSALHTRLDMVKREFLGGKMSAAILAAAFIARVNVAAI